MGEMYSQEPPKLHHQLPAPKKCKIRGPSCQQSKLPESNLEKADFRVAGG